MKIIFYAVVGNLKNEKEWVQSIHLDYEKAYNQYMANGMSGMETGRIDWRIEILEGIGIPFEEKCTKPHIWDTKLCPLCENQKLEDKLLAMNIALSKLKSKNKALKEQVNQERHDWRRHLDK